ncbi:MAG: Uma2 family endonuclease [Chloroflexota bacterium]|nr:Uma2 family endonuclease [Chloroflexota bacterium]
MTVTTTGKRKPAQVQPYRWTRQEYDKMVEIELFAPEARLELIEGEILEMAPQTSYHTVALSLTQRHLERIYGTAFYVRVQMSLALSEDSEPEPDLAVIVGDPRDYWHEHPKTALLIVEVAYSTLDYDQQRKRRLYARRAIPEYWILNLNQSRLEVYRQPQDDDYQSHVILEADARVAPLSQPDGWIAIADLLLR